MTVREKLESDIHDSMRRRNRERLGALRYLKSAIRQVEIDQQKTLDEPGIMDVIAKQVKDRRESIRMFQEGNRPDLAAKESAELAVLEEYLPPQLSREELTQLVQKAIEEVGAASIRDKGRVMGRVMPQVRGKADGAEVNSVVTQLLESGAASD
jgi:uncharacterized protein YqeY